MERAAAGTAGRRETLPCGSNKNYHIDTVSYSYSFGGNEFKGFPPCLLLEEASESLRVFMERAAAGTAG
jgi:hypothetical protein